MLFFQRAWENGRKNVLHLEQRVLGEKHAIFQQEMTPNIWLKPQALNQNCESSSVAQSNTDFNPIEHLWNYLKLKFTNSLHPIWCSLSVFCRTLRDAWRKQRDWMFFFVGTARALFVFIDLQIIVMEVMGASFVLENTRSSWMKKCGSVYRNRCWGAGKRCMLASAKQPAFLLELQCVTVMVSLRLLITSEMETISLAWEVSRCCSLSAVKVLRSSKGLIWEKGGRNRLTVWPVITRINSWVTFKKNKKQRIHVWVLFRCYIMQNITEEKLKNRVLENDYFCNTHFSQVDGYFRGNVPMKKRRKHCLSCSNPG